MQFVIIGSGRMGAGLARTLSMQGHQLIVVDVDPAAFANLGPNFKGRTVVGVGFDRDVLAQADVTHADGLAALTTSDEANVVIARMASEVYRVPKVVARLFDPGKAEIYRRLGLQTIAPVTWGVNRMAELLCQTGVGPVMSLGAGTVDLIETVIVDGLVGRTVRDITITGEVHVVAISRAGRTFLPTLGTVLQHNDMVHLAVLGSSADRLQGLLGL
ncbi:MAG: potassium channel family protein [Anaerolineae bacterium]